MMQSLTTVSRLSNDQFNMNQTLGDDNMNSSDQISFEMIAKNGAARSLFIEAVQAAKNGNTSEAIRLMEEGEVMLIEGHMIHGELITKYARGEGVQMDLLLVHAEDQLMAAEMFKLMAREYIEIYGRLSRLEADRHPL